MYITPLNPHYLSTAMKIILANYRSPTTIEVAAAVVAVLTVLGFVLLFSIFVGGVSAGGPGCSETDSGFNVVQRGVTKNIVNGQESVDYCMNKEILMEYVCTDGNVDFSQSNCSSHPTHKFCQNGACVENFVNQTDYSDSDGGKDYSVQGVLKSPAGNEMADYCINYSYLKEYFTVDSPLG